MKKKFLILLLIACLWLIPSGISAADTYVVTLKDSCTMTEAQKEAYHLEQLTAVDHGFYVTDEKNADKLENNSKVETVEPANTLRLCFSPNDPKYKAGSQWGLAAVHMEKAWDITRGKKKMHICVIDSGFDFTHEDKGANIIAGKDYTTNKKTYKDYDFHGTATAGIIGAATDNNIGIAGLCDGCKLFVLTAFSDKTGDDYTVAAAIYDAIDVYDADVISMSFGGNVVADELGEAIRYAYSHGAILVASSGNDGNKTGEEKNQLLYPAAYDEVIGVGAIDSSFATPGYSTANSSVYVCAPGSSILTTVPTGSVYSSVSGTSFAAPFVAALAGMARSLDPGITQKEFCDYLKATATDLNTTGYDIKTGWGLVNFEKLLTVLKADSEAKINIEEEKQKLEAEQQKLNEELKRLEADQQKLNEEKQKLGENQQALEAKQKALEDELNKLKEEQKKLEQEWNKLEEEWKKLEEAKNPPTTVQFSDVSEDQWYYESVMTLAKDGIINGYPDGTFGPNRQISRAEIVKIMANIAHANISGIYRLTFTDVPRDAWYLKELVWAVEMGLINGRDATHFCPNAPITREELCCIMARYLKNIAFIPLSETAVLDFKDKNTISDWAVKSVMQLTDIGIINGFEDRTFRPRATATRAQTAKMTDAMRKYIKNAQ